jgi:hypothetical protein
MSTTSVLKSNFLGLTLLLLLLLDKTVDANLDASQTLAFIHDDFLQLCYLLLDQADFS